MIDTDDYEGHTPNEWIVEEGANGDTLVSSFHPSEDGLQTDIALVYSNHIDAQLIAAAPDLLAEVKRMQKEIEVLVKYRDIVNKYDDALLADGDTDIRWSAIYDEEVFE